MHHQPVRVHVAVDALSERAPLLDEGHHAPERPERLVTLGDEHFELGAGQRVEIQGVPDGDDVEDQLVELRHALGRLEPMQAQVVAVDVFRREPELDVALVHPASPAASVGIHHADGTPSLGAQRTGDKS